MKTEMRLSKDSFSEQAEEVFCAAVEVADAVERRAFVERACAGNDSLRAHVEALLSAQVEVGEFFDEASPALRSDESDASFSGHQVGGGINARPVLTERIGTAIGPYRLAEVLGEGGCGVVYMAEQEKPFHRRVALKIIKLGMDTKSVIARFEAERQALALMDHPNIAHVLDAGATDSGRPYFVMELVQGTKLTTFCDKNQYDTRRRLNLFIQVCHAIQHAHQKGIIHRDIKPSNILVTLHDGQPMPMVIDFGIAKAIQGRLTDQTLFTPSEHFIGTPAYMSPEQAQSSRIDVDTRSDIYGLGVLLYELLAGKTPFESDRLAQLGLDEMRRTLAESEPPRPSSMVTTMQGELLARTAQSRQAEPVKLVSLLRGDLDWIVMMALEKDRNRRYQTANALAMDVQRYLDNEPVVARPPSRVYQLQKLIRRNKVVFASVAAVALCLTAGFTVVTTLLVRERELRERAVAAEQEQARLRAEAEHGLATEAELRRQAEWRENIRQAAVLLGREAYAEADQLVAQLPLDPSTMEGAQVLRTLGEWDALQGHWAAARDRFHALQRVSRFDTPNNTSLDAIRSAVAYVESDDRAGYEHYCQDGIASLAGNDDQIVAGRIVKNCLLLPASKELLTSLEPAAHGVEQSLIGVDYSAADLPWPIPWRCLTVALWEYRKGNPSEAMTWCYRCLAAGDAPPPRSIAARTILAMSLYKLGQVKDARSELEKERVMIEAKFQTPLDMGNSDTGVWFDWVTCRILLREATSLMEVKP